MKKFSIVCLSLFVMACTSVPLREPASTLQELNSKRGLQHPSLLKWAKAQRGTIRDIDFKIASEFEKFNVPERIDHKLPEISNLTANELRRIEQSTQLYFDLFGRDSVQSLLWTGIESGNPLTREVSVDPKTKKLGYRWNSLREIGLYDPILRAKTIDRLKQLGIRNIRLGLSNHEIELNNDKTWEFTSQLIEEFSRAGFRISLDLHHFGIEDQFAVRDEAGKINHMRSFYLNSHWPDYFAAFAGKVIRKYHHQVQAFTIMNEPETVIGFNGEMWHGGYPGWSHKDSNLIYIQRAIQVALASVKARIKIEEFLAKLPTDQRPKIAFLHTEASVHKMYWEDFNLYRRFVISDLILGHEWLTSADFKSILQMPMEKFIGRWHQTPKDVRSNLDWVIENYVVFERQVPERKRQRADLVRRLSALQSAHSELKTNFGKEMRDNTIFAVDYYAHNEDKDGKGERLNPEPQYYVEQVKEGRRAGLARVLIDYFNRYKMPLMIGESGTPYFHYGAKWNQQMLLECATVAEMGVPFLGYTLYPALDTWGWESALSVPKEKALYNPSGLMDLDRTPRPFVQKLIESLSQQMPVQ